MSKLTSKRKLGLGAYAAVALGASASLVACQWIAGIHTYDADEPTPDGGQTSFEAGPIPEASTIYSDAPAPDLCNAAHPPVAPETSDDGGDQTLIYTFAMKDLSVFSASAADVIGYDIDNACTCFSGGHTANPGPSCAVPDGSVVACDGLNGIDNELAQLVAPLASTALFGGQTLDAVAGVQTQITDGTQTVLIELLDYNGQANDNEVRILVARSEHLESKGCFDGGAAIPFDAGRDGGAFDASPGGGNFQAGAPAWDGCDTWSVSSTALDGLGAFAYAADVAYVTNYRLVAQFNGGVLIPFGPAGVVPQKPLFTATLTPSTAFQTDGAPGFALTKGAIQGRLPATSIFSAIGALKSPLASDHGIGLCATSGSALYADIKSQLCSHLDISSVADDIPDPCDSVTFVGSFDAVPAHAGDPVIPEVDPYYPGCYGAPDSCFGLAASDAGSGGDSGDD